MRLSLHSAQRKVFNSRANVKVLVSGRGFGKTWLMVVSAINACLSYPHKVSPNFPLQALVLLPTLKMATKSHWLTLMRLLKDSPFVERIDKTNRIIYFKNDKPFLAVDSLEGGGDRIRGANLIWVGIDEFQDIQPGIWDKVVLPCFRTNQTPIDALICGTPKGTATAFYKFHLKAKSTQGWQYFHFKSEDRPNYPKKTLAQAKATLPERVYAQEYEATWVDAPGAFFDCLKDSHLIDILPASYDKLFIGLDFGSMNPAISLIGIKNTNHYLIDCWLNPHPGLSVTEGELIEQIAAIHKKYQSSAPSKEFYVKGPDDNPSIVLSIQKYGRDKGIEPLTRAATLARNKPGPIGRASVANSLFHQDRLYINKALQNVVDDFRSYHRAQNSAGEFLDKVAEGQSDHSVDSALLVLAFLNAKYILKAA